MSLVQYILHVRLELYWHNLWLKTVLVRTVVIAYRFPGPGRIDRHFAIQHRHNLAEAERARVAPGAYRGYSDRLQTLTNMRADPPQALLDLWNHHWVQVRHIGIPSAHQ